jgi:hypothetical protein
MVNFRSLLRTLSAFGAIISIEERSTPKSAGGFGSDYAGSRRELTSSTDVDRLSRF